MGLGKIKGYYSPSDQRRNAYDGPVWALLRRWGPSHGASAILLSSDSTIEDEDIDKILMRGKEKTKLLQDKIREIIPDEQYML